MVLHNVKVSLVLALCNSSPTAVSNSNNKKTQKMNALSCVSQDDIVSLRIICTLAANHNYDIEELDQYGNTALLKACFLGRFECARTLLEFGANIYAINYLGQNALTLAAYAGHLQLVFELLRHRTYQDFNLSSLIPAICVAAMRQHFNIVDHFRGLDPSGTAYVQTVHGLGVNDISDMVHKAKSNRPKNKSWPLSAKHHRYR